MSKIRNIIFVFLSLLLIVSCSSEKEIVKTEKIIPANRLLKKLEGNRRKIKTFEGNGILNIKSEEFSGKTSFKIYIKKPDSIKISIYGPFGIDIAHGLFSKDKFEFYDVLKNRVIIGENSKDVLEKLFKVNLSFEDLIDAFAGAVNLTENLRKEPTDYEEIKNIYNLTYVDRVENKKNLYRITKDGLKITDYYVLSLSDKELLSAEYSDFQNYEDVPVPRSLLIRNKAKHQSINIKYKKIKVNENISSLKINLPSDVKIIKW